MTDTHDHDNDGWGETIYVHSDGAPHATPDSPLPGGPPVPNQTLIEEALTLPCPHCGAQPGEQCHSGWIDNLPLPAGAKKVHGPRYRATNHWNAYGHARTDTETSVMTDTDNTTDDYDEAPPNLGDMRVALRRYANALSVTADESEWTNTKVEMSPQDARELADTLFHALVFLFQTDAESKNR